jgi:shikimate 5-dehydrogenase
MAHRYKQVNKTATLYTGTFLLIHIPSSGWGGPEDQHHLASVETEALVHASPDNLNRRPLTNVVKSSELVHKPDLALDMTATKRETKLLTSLTQGTH